VAAPAGGRGNRGGRGGAESPVVDDSSKARAEAVVAAALAQVGSKVQDPGFRAVILSSNLFFVPLRCGPAGQRSHCMSVRGHCRGVLWHECHATRSPRIAST
jgi:hypothetical protein